MNLCVDVTACFDNANTHFTQEKSVYKQNKRYVLTIIYVSFWCTLLENFL